MITTESQIVGCFINFILWFDIKKLSVYNFLLFKMCKYARFRNLKTICWIFFCFQIMIWQSSGNLTCLFCWTGSNQTIRAELHAPYPWFLHDHPRRIQMQCTKAGHALGIRICGCSSIKDNSEPQNQRVNLQVCALAAPVLTHSLQS